VSTSSILPNINYKRNTTNCLPSLVARLKVVVLVVVVVVVVVLLLFNKQQSNKPSRVLLDFRYRKDVASVASSAYSCCCCTASLAACGTKLSSIAAGAVGVVDKVVVLASGEAPAGMVVCNWNVACAEPEALRSKFWFESLLNNRSANSINCDRRLWLGMRRLE
jgi:hypothetical protein